jgi:hypothetical protein
MLDASSSGPVEGALPRHCSETSNFAICISQTTALMHIFSHTFSSHQFSGIPEEGSAERNPNRTNTLSESDLDSWLVLIESLQGLESAERNLKH